MVPSDFAQADIQAVVENLSLEESISLIAGKGFWYTHAVPRLGIPAIKVSDGPNGVRGKRFFMSTLAKCLPCATALAATWDTELVRGVGEKLLAAEAKLRAASVILAPTVNIQRSPLGGRSFESFSEDPHLSGHIASAYVNGIQKEGISACIKHFVANDQEDDRMALDSIVSQRALREIYLMPFMLAQKMAKPSAIMTAYNRVNGTHCPENPMLKTILRDEWGFDGLIMSDWFGMYSVSESINAGLDLEMPGIRKWRTLEHTMRALASGKITLRTIKERATKVLELVQKCARGAPEILDGDDEEHTRDTEAEVSFMRKVASDSIVLLKNEGGLLPLDADVIKKIAIIGPNAKARTVSGGGSVGLRPSYVTTPYQGIVDALPKDVEVLYNEGVIVQETLPSLDQDIVTEDGEAGWTMSWHNVSEDGNTILPDVIQRELVEETSAMLVDTKPPDGLNERWGLRLSGKLRARAEKTKFEFGLTVSGRARLFVDGRLLIDNWTRQRQGNSFFGMATVEERGVVDLVEGQSPSVLVEFSNVIGQRGGPGDGQLADPIVRLRGRCVVDEDLAMDGAVECARTADVAIVVVGLNGDWESEGHDRTTLDLPGRMNELVEKVAKANSRTVVVTQSGSAITMPWINSVHTLVHGWYLGNATGDAIADVIFGKVNPSGKLSLTFPRKLEDTPAHGHYGSENGKVWYAEELFVGYKHYLHRKIDPLFPFGFGLSYTTFDYSDLALSTPVGAGADFNVTALVKITNSGTIGGCEVVQLYVSLPSTSRLTHPPRALRAFAKVRVEPGESATVELVLDKYAVSYWGESVQHWVAEAGEYAVHVGASSVDIKARAVFVLSKAFEWSGL